MFRAVILTTLKDMDNNRLFWRMVIWYVPMRRTQENQQGIAQSVELWPSQAGTNNPSNSLGNLVSATPLHKILVQIKLYIYAYFHFSYHFYIFKTNCTLPMQFYPCLSRSRTHSANRASSQISVHWISAFGILLKSRLSSFQIPIVENPPLPVNSLDFSQAYSYVCTLSEHAVQKLITPGWFCPCHYHLPCFLSDLLYLRSCSCR